MTQEQLNEKFKEALFSNSYEKIYRYIKLGADPNYEFSGFRTKLPLTYLSVWLSSEYFILDIIRPSEKNDIKQIFKIITFLIKNGADVLRKERGTSFIEHLSDNINFFRKNIKPDHIILKCFFSDKFQNLLIEKSPDSVYVLIKHGVLNKRLSIKYKDLIAADELNLL